MTKTMNIAVEELMSRELVVVKPTDTTKEVERLFLAYNIHHLPVVDDAGKLQGLISKTDLYKAKAKPEGAVQVTDIMTHQVATAAPGTPLREVAEIFLSNIMHAMPVVDEGELIGLVTAQDVLRYCLVEQRLLEE
jgi:CBS domain-containing membrane protein